jgi:hypothetical protein
VVGHIYFAVLLAYLGVERPNLTHADRQSALERYLLAALRPLTILGRSERRAGPLRKWQ